MKIKVVWICSVANEEIAKTIGSKTSFFAAPWITELINIFRDRDDVELSIISPNYFDNQYSEFKLGFIKVYLYKYRRGFIPHRGYNLSYNYNTANKSIIEIVSKINPDIVHLHGSENPFYGSAVVQLLDKIPTLITIQGFVSLSSIPKNLIRRYIRWNRIRYETILNSRATYFGTSAEETTKFLRTFNKDAIIFNDYYPTTKPRYSSDDFPIKKYDIVYYARLSQDKGIEDLIIALSILKKNRPNISLLIIGGGNLKYIKYLKRLIESSDLKHNINFVGFLSSQQEVFKLAAECRIYVLPTHFDALPGSLREAMFMKIPVVSNSVGGIPGLNEKMECVTLAESGNIHDLAVKIELVLNNTQRTNQLVKNAYSLIKDKYDNSKIYHNILSIYKNILERENERSAQTN